jgi:hypothetical protein
MWIEISGVRRGFIDLEEMNSLNSQGATNRVALAGGLGNQLFQLAAGLYVAQGNQLTLDGSLGYSRHIESRKIELTSFILPANVHVNTDKEYGYLRVRIFNLALRTSSARNSFSVARRIHAALRPIAKVLLHSLWILNRPYIASEIGYDSKIRDVVQPVTLIGYFQTYKYLEDPKVRTAINALRLVGDDSVMQELIAAAATDRPLVVHFRFGDYESESEFGTPDLNYYISGITKLWAIGIYKSLWVFSDDMDRAREFLHLDHIKSVRFISDFQDSASKSFELMRYGHGYVLSNSTFGWWAASLSYVQNPRVVVPNPWFSNMQTPCELIPSNWEQLNAVTQRLAQNN